MSKDFRGCNLERKWSRSVMSDFLRPHGQQPAPGSSVHGIFSARVLEWVAISFSKVSSQGRDRTQLFYIVDRRFTIWATREVDIFWCLQLSKYFPKFFSVVSIHHQQCMRVPDAHDLCSIILHCLQCL